MAKARLTASQVRKSLGLEPLPLEGGFFAETYRSAGDLEETARSGLCGGPRRLATAIYYLLTPESGSALHRLASDEVFHFYLGDPAEMLLLRPDGSGEVILLGQDLESGQRPQVVVPGGTWQGCRLCDGGGFALLGCTVSPGFEREDCEHGDQAALMRAYPAYSDRILALSPRSRRASETLP